MQRLEDRELSTNDHTRKYKYLTIHKDYIGIGLPSGGEYDIDFNRCSSCAEICNWLGQIAEKSWSNAELLGELVMAFNTINGDLRGVR